MLEENQPVGDTDRELTDTDLDLVSGGDKKPVVKPKPKPTANGDYLLTIDGILGESSDTKHKGEIQLES